LEVKTHDKNFRWKLPLVVDKASKQKIQATFDEIFAACEKSGLSPPRFFGPEEPRAFARLEKDLRISLR